jgi:hypothetical protein
LVVKVLGPVNVLLQRTKKTKPFVAHIDKVKPYEADELPASWLITNTKDDDAPKGPVEVVGTREAVPPSADAVGVDRQQSAPAPPAEAYEDALQPSIAGMPLEDSRQPRPKRIVSRPRRYEL